MANAWRLTQPTITRVCRAVRLECLPHFYKANAFIIYGCDNFASRLNAWLAAIGAENRAALQHLYYSPGSARFGIKQQLGRVPDSNEWTVRRGDFDYDDVDKLYPELKIGASWE